MINHKFKRRILAVQQNKFEKRLRPGEVLPKFQFDYITDRIHYLLTLFTCEENVYFTACGWFVQHWFVTITELLLNVAKE